MDIINHVAADFQNTQEYLDNYFYTKESNLAREKFFGATYLSTGGPESTKDLCRTLHLKPGDKVLDIGCGLGGSAFHMAQQYGANVIGVDMSRNAIDVLMERMAKSPVQNVTFMLADVTEAVFPEESFDIVYSRDSIMHIIDSLRVYSQCYKWLKPGGKLLVTNYCCQEKEKSEAYKTMVKVNGYHLRSIEEIKQMISRAGFQKIQVQDQTQMLIQYHRQSVSQCEKRKDEFLKSFTDGTGEIWFKMFKDGLEEEAECGVIGDFVWGHFLAIKE